MIYVIGISGKKRVGKDTFSLMLHQHTNLPCKRVAFADFLKEEVYEYVLKKENYSKSYLEDHKENFRLILQGWGTDFRRCLCNNDYWINKMEDTLIKLHQEYKDQDLIVIIPDIRFKNEAEFIRRHSGILVRINRLPTFLDKLKSALGFVPDRHIGEINLDHYQFDWVVKNNSTLENLEKQAIKFIQTFELY